MTEERASFLLDRLKAVEEKIESARERRGGGKPVALLAASKTMPAEDIVLLAERGGLRLCGENHVQEFRDKYDAVKAAGCDVDLIGHLQTNKVKYVAGRARLIHSLDSIRLAEALEKRCASLCVTQDVLVELNIGGEETKTGVDRDVFPRLLEEVARFPHIRVRGMMVMAPKSDEKEEIRKYFRESYKIFLDFFGRGEYNIGESILSMGMSDSYEIAVEEGADLVRVGSAIFGART